MLSKRINLLHDNACPQLQLANHTQDLIGSFGWEQPDPPSYSTDLAPSDYHLFHLWMHLGGQRQNYDLVKMTMLQWLSAKLALL